MLVDCLLDGGYEDLAVLDISGSSLEIAKVRLDDRADNVEWFEADATIFKPTHHFHLWHDRAVFHFLTDERDRSNYVNVLKEALLPLCIGLLG